MTSDENVKKIARFLENGGTMLASHCETCGAPLFRFKGEIICPICSGVETDRVPAPASKNAAPAASPLGSPAKKSGAPQNTGQKKKKEQEQAEIKGTIERPFDATERTLYSVDGERLRELILFKITEVAEDMQNETDPRRIYENLELIEKGLDIIERLS
ncbi:MAG: hypothetical protein FWE78_06250 [Methanimicrococcus sp.]|nr:hypothetical protein [Methanimicrococcus sp.]